MGLAFGPTSLGSYFGLIFLQVRIKVLEGRQLAGANIHPVVKVTLGKESKQTRVKSATNRPHYDEVLHIDAMKNFFFSKIVKPCLSKLS